MRKRLHRREIPGDIRFITFSCQRRLPLLRNARIARLVIDRLAEMREGSGVRLYAYVIMPEHVHLLLAPPPPTPNQATVDLAEPLAWLKHGVAITVLARWRELDASILTRLRVASGYRFWQKGGGFDRNIRDETEFAKTVRYIHENPVERGLVKRADLYEFSSARWWLARCRGERPSMESGVAPCDEPPGGDRWTSWRGFMSWPDGEHV